MISYFSSFINDISPAYTDTIPKVYAGDFLKTKKAYVIAGFIFTAVLGTLAHFFYNWSGNNPLIGLFTPVNESTWEHMKLLFFPAVLWSLFLPGQLAENAPGLRPALLLGTIAGTVSIPVLFYTYSGILGRNVAWVDIAIFFIATAITYIFAFKTSDFPYTKEKRTIIRLLIILFTICFIIFTWLPPDIALFAEP